MKDIEVLLRKSNRFLTKKRREREEVLVDSKVKKVNERIDYIEKDVSGVLEVSGRLKELSERALGVALETSKQKGERGRRGLRGLKGLDGYTPVKGVDYFDGVDGKDGKDGKTPKKGVDYFTKLEIEKIKNEVKPLKGVDYFDGKDGGNGRNGSPDSAEDIRDKLGSLKGGARLNATYSGSLVSTNINQITENSGEGVTGNSTFISTKWFSNSINGTLGSSMPRMDSRNSSVSSYISQALSGKPKKIYYVDPYLTTYPSGFYWSTEVSFSANTSGIFNSSPYFATGGYDMNFIYPDRAGWDVFLGTFKKNDTFRLGKTIRVIVLDEDKNPIEGARVSFLSNSGVNLTKGNSATTIASVFVANSSVENYEEAETVLHHDDPWVITQQRASYGYASLKENTSYWFRGEKIGIGTKSATAEPYNAAYYRYTAERGLDGTPTGWNLGNTTNADLFFEALDYVETDSNGLAFNQVTCKTYKWVVSSSNLISNLLMAGDIGETNYFPITVRVEANNKMSTEVVIGEQFAIDQGITPVTVTVVLNKQNPVVVANGRVCVNPDPANSKNSFFI